MFDETYLEKLNDKIAEKIDSRLYLAAYYHPKRVSSDTSSEHVFWTAITNIYSLFADCAGYVKIDLLNLLYKNNVLEESDKRKISDFVQLIKSIRSLFCHNMSSELDDEIQKQLEDFNNFLKRQLHRKNLVVSIPYEMSLPPEDWEKLIRYLYSESQSCFEILDESINKISERNKDKIVDEWLEAIAKWYGRSFYFETAAKNFFEFKHRTLEKSANNNNDVGKSVYSQEKNNWIKEQRREWKENGKNYMKKLNEPVFPIIINCFLFSQVTRECSHY